MKDLELINHPLSKEIVEIIENGNELQENSNFNEALSFYQSAWNLLPESKLEWNMLTSWISGCIASVYMDTNQYDLAKKWTIIELNTKSSDIDTGPVINMGIVCFELGEFEKSYQYFNTAYEFGKRRSFQERPKKYLEFYLNKKNGN